MTEQELAAIAAMVSKMMGGAQPVVAQAVPQAVPVADVRGKTVSLVLKADESSDNFVVYGAHDTSAQAVLGKRFPGLYFPKAQMGAGAGNVVGEITLTITCGSAALALASVPHTERKPQAKADKTSAKSATPAVIGWR